MIKIDEITEAAKRKEKEEKIKKETRRVIKMISSIIKNENYSKIIRYIQENKKVTFKQLKREFDLNSNTLNFCLKRLKSSYVVSQKYRGGLYRLGEIGPLTITLLDVVDNTSIILEDIMNNPPKQIFTR